ncbi:hypothetical protein GQ55_2G263600 [Panicum hallii var. hallii]|uniref:Uncharacterized protein n=1 Tax=Panicum hallii var. hallii TaxID=1504633 RepID=A0A2T7ESJ6_9POAL|nr:hypothetical protein GQ55_2G263600 [Panicum hallii var. hallii]
MVPSLLRAAKPVPQSRFPIPPHTPTQNHRQIFRSYLSPLRRSREAVTAAARAGPAESITALLLPNPTRYGFHGDLIYLDAVQPVYFHPWGRRRPGSDTISLSRR